MLRKQQWYVIAAGAVVLFSLFVFGKFTPPHVHKENTSTEAKPAVNPNFDFEQYVAGLKKDLTPTQSAYLTSLEDAISRGDLVTQKQQNFQALSNFWRDSAHAFTPYIYYLGEKAKLENSEKSLNFAAHSMLEELRGIADPALKSWMANQANELFKKSLVLNPTNDSTIIGQGSTFFFGADGAPMEGIMNIRKVAEKNPDNVFAQFMLGYGGLISGQNEKAIERFTKVVALDPENTEAIFLLAEMYEREGKKKEAIVWYEKGLTKVKNPELVKALEEKINSLK